MGGKIGIRRIKNSTVEH